MNGKIAELFKKEKIEYFSALSYSDCREINPQISGRLDFHPKSAFVFLLPYYTGKTENISLYAASLDYHIIIKSIGERLLLSLSKIYPEAHFCIYGDHSPIDERDAALRTGLGIKGDNGLLINEKYGSFVFIADIISDLSAEEAECATPCQIKSCISCGKCKSACPTGMLRGEGEDCLSAITQRKGELTSDEVSLMKEYNTVWGCDICQTVCPYNSLPEATPIEDFYFERIELLTAELLSSMDNDAFSRRAFAWRGRKTVERNLKLLDY